VRSNHNNSAGLKSQDELQTLVDSAEGDLDLGDGDDDDEDGSGLLISRKLTSKPKMSNIELPLFAYIKEISNKRRSFD
jgi:hypothetical protein